ncbi:MAG: OmpA family protein [Saprospiraceae bacterium]
MKLSINALSTLFVFLMFTSCVTKKKYVAMETDLTQQLEVANRDLGKCGEELNEYMAKLNTAEEERASLQAVLNFSQEELEGFKTQVEDAELQLKRQMTTVGDLTVLNQDARDNIDETLAQLEAKNIYIDRLIAAKSKADSINLALAFNLQSNLEDGLNDESIDVKVDKTVVFVNLSDKMLYRSGSATLNSKSNDVLAKIAKMIKDRPDLEVMVEGYTDNVPMKNSCMKDNWDLSVKRATSVVRALQDDHGINPDRLIAAGRGEYNVIADNSTKEGRATNRRTRIVIMPKLSQFYNTLEASPTTSNE